MSACKRCGYSKDTYKVTIADQIYKDLEDVPYDKLLGHQGCYIEPLNGQEGKYEVIHVGYVSTANSDINALIVEYLYLSKENGAVIPLVLGMVEDDNTKRLRMLSRELIWGSSDRQA